MKLTVNFTAQGRMLEGTMYLPEDSSKIFAACLFEGSMTGATAQLTEHIARKVSEQGLITLIMDHNYFGEDETSPQPWESPTKRLHDIKSALHFLANHASVDEDRIVGVGVSVGAEYLARASHESDLLKGLVMIEGPFDDAQNMVGHLDIPSIIIDETHLDAAADETVLWVRTLFNGSQAMNRESFGKDWSIADK